MKPLYIVALQVTPEVIRELDHAGAGRGSRGTAAGLAGGAAPMAVAGGMAGGAQLAGPRVGQNVVESVRDLPPVLMMED